MSDADRKRLIDEGRTDLVMGEHHRTSTAGYRELQHMQQERDNALTALTLLQVHHHNTIKSLLNQTDVAVAAMAERDAALATIARVWAVVLSSNAALVVDRVRAAIEEPTKGQP